VQLILPQLAELTVQPVKSCLSVCLSVPLCQLSAWVFVL